MESTRRRWKWTLLGVGVYALWMLVMGPTYYAGDYGRATSGFSGTMLLALVVWLLGIVVVHVVQAVWGKQ